MKKSKIFTNKPVYLGLSILQLSKTLMYEFRYDSEKPKYGAKVKLCYIFIVHIKTDNIDRSYLFRDCRRR